MTFGLGAFDAAWFTARGETLADGRDMPILLVHGTADQLAPLAVAERARDALAAAEWEVTLRSFEGGHTMPVEEVAFAVEWLRKSVAAQTPARPGSAPKVLAGTFAPSGPPARPPVRVAAGDGCVVDLQQAYIVSGDLAGSARIDYRILVEGPCGPPPGTFAEEWIAHGTFTGTLNGTAASARLRYTARVQPGGEVDGRIVLGQGLAGELRVQGNFGDSRLSYSGRVERD